MSTEKFVMDNFLSIVATVFVGERRSVCAFQSESERELLKESND